MDLANRLQSRRSVSFIDPTLFLPCSSWILVLGKFWVSHSTSFLFSAQIFAFLYLPPASLILSKLPLFRNRLREWASLVYSHIKFCSSKDSRQFYGPSTLWRWTVFLPDFSTYIIISLAVAPSNEYFLNVPAHFSRRQMIFLSSQSTNSSDSFSMKPLPTLMFIFKYFYQNTPPQWFWPLKSSDLLYWCSLVKSNTNLRIKIMT